MLSIACSQPALIRSAVSRRFLSSSKKPSSSFKPRRRPDPKYRPVTSAKGASRTAGYDPLTADYEPLVVLGKYPDARDELEQQFGPQVANFLRAKQISNKLGGDMDAEEYLRAADYLSSEPGSLEEKIGERRALAMSFWDETDRREFTDELEKVMEEERVAYMKLDEFEYTEEELADTETLDPIDAQIEKMEAAQIDENGEHVDPLRLAHGVWGEMVVRVDRVAKAQKGGRMVRYRSLVIGGNANGCGGFGIGKAGSPQEATKIASRMCRRNIFFVDRHHGTGLTTDLVGRHNSCKVTLRCVQPKRGMRGHPLICDILLYCGISDCSSKSHGNRNQYNIVYATFKALLCHRNMEEMAMTRGKRLMNIERAERLGV